MAFESHCEMLHLLQKNYYMCLQKSMGTVPRTSTTRRNNCELRYIMESYTAEIRKYQSYTDFVLKLQN